LTPFEFAGAARFFRHRVMDAPDAVPCTTITGSGQSVSRAQESSSHVAGGPPAHGHWATRLRRLDHVGALFNWACGASPAAFAKRSAAIEEGMPQRKSASRVPGALRPRAGGLDVIGTGNRIEVETRNESVHSSLR